MERESPLLEQIHAIVGDAGMLVGDDVAARSCEPFAHVPPGSPAIIRPASTEDLSKVLTLCHAAGQKIVTHGGRTGVAGGALASETELVVSLERMTRIIEIDTIGSTMTVEAGATIEAVQAAAQANGLFYPIDLGSKGTATLGGTIATNAGGNRVLRWGMTRQNILGIEVVLADGTILSALNRFLKNNTGYDLKHLFIGSEGTLGIVTKAVLNLVPAPTTQKAAFVAMDSYEKVLALLASARRLQQLSAFEVMWRSYYAMVSGADPTRRPLGSDLPFYILVETMGTSEAEDETAFMAFLEDAMDRGLIADAVVARSGKQLGEFWRVREASEVLVAQMGPFVSFDISVDIRRANAFVETVRSAVEATFGANKTIEFGHLGDSNIHIGVHVGEDTRSCALAVEKCVYDVVAQFGGALTAEHGIGTAKRPFLPDHVSPAALATMRRIRQSIDSSRILNNRVLF